VSTWIALVAIGVGTYALRVSMFLVVGERELPGWVSRSLDLVGPAAVAALVASMVFVQHESVHAPIASTAAVLVGFLVVRRTGNVTHAFLAGLPTFWLLSAAGL
jgi:branched chain amino acid efflux pump